MSNEFKNGEILNVTVNGYVHLCAYVGKVPYAKDSSVILMTGAVINGTPTNGLFSAENHMLSRD